MTKQEFEVWTEQMKQKLQSAVKGAKEMKERTENLNKKADVFFEKVKKSQKLKD